LGDGVTILKWILECECTGWRVSEEGPMAASFCEHDTHIYTDSMISREYFCVCEGQ